MALPAPMRFRNRNDVRRLLRYGRRLDTVLGRFFFTPACGSRGRFLVIISTSVVKKSTERNKIKRRLNEFVSRVNSEFFSRMDIAVLINKGIAPLSKKALLSLAQESVTRVKSVKI